MNQRVKVASLLSAMIEGLRGGGITRIMAGALPDRF
jgi:hypothetical protein